MLIFLMTTFLWHVHWGMVIIKIYFVNHLSQRYHSHLKLKIQPDQL